MMNFFSRTKRNAKKRLIDCINDDRRLIGDKTAENICREIEKAIGKFAVIDGGTQVEICKENSGYVYIKAQARLSGLRL